MIFLLKEHFIPTSWTHLQILNDTKFSSELKEHWFILANDYIEASILRTSTAHFSDLENKSIWKKF